MRKHSFEKVVLIIGGIIFIIAAFVFVLFHYEEPKIMFEGEPREVSDVEEILSNRLESENPTLDLEVNISEEYDNN